MKKYSIVQVMTGIMLAISLSLTAVSALAEDHHQHDLDTAELQLNAGQKWQTDAPLRQAMGEISQAVNSSLDDIHNNQLDATGYAALADEVNQQVAYMVENCELEPAADAQLHIVIARLINGAQLIEKNSAIEEKRQGAVQLIGALDGYAEYFNDDKFVKPTH
ncbi:MAG TPA: hypothetical protein GX719_12015 [Gammaproteobacteria bacterium]|nr:hypothetical protein [Gammaproteobacteria bacterium]